MWHLTAGLPYLVRLMNLRFNAPRTRVRGLDFAARVEVIGRNVRGFLPGDGHQRGADRLESVVGRRRGDGARHPRGLPSAGSLVSAPRRGGGEVTLDSVGS